MIVDDVASKFCRALSRGHDDVGVRRDVPVR